MRSYKIVYKNLGLRIIGKVLNGLKIRQSNVLPHSTFLTESNSLSDKHKKYPSIVNSVVSGEVYPKPNTLRNNVVAVA